MSRKKINEHLSKIAPGEFMAEFDQDDADFVKWIIGISAGFLVFYAQHVGPQAHVLWKGIVIGAMLLLLLSMFSGMDFVGRHLVYKKYLRGLAVLKERRHHYEQMDSQQQISFDGKTLYTEDVLNIYQKHIDEYGQKIAHMYVLLERRYYFQKTTFILATVIIAASLITSIFIR